MARRASPPGPSGTGPIQACAAGRRFAQQDNVFLWLLLPLPPLQQIAKWLAFRAHFIGKIRTLFNRIRETFLRFIGPFGDSIPSVTVGTPQVLPQLLSRLRSKQQTDRRTDAKSNQQKSYGCSYPGLGTFIFSSTHI